MQSFRFIHVLPLAASEVIVLSPLGDAAGRLQMWILEGLPRLIILVFNSNHTSILHRFRFIQVLPLAWE